MNRSMPPIVLASASPRRQALLRDLKLPFSVRVAGVDETPLAGEKPAALALRLAEAKAIAVADRIRDEFDDCLVVAADTVVAQNGLLLGKPVDADDATHMLALLRAQAHQVYSGLCVLDQRDSRRHTIVNVTSVTMRAYTDDEIHTYVATGDPLDKAGGYAIQHVGFAPVATLDGCLAGVMGFPLADLCDLLAKCGVEVEASLPDICERHTAFRCCRRCSQIADQLKP